MRVFHRLVLTHPRTGFIFRRIKSLFHHSNWQHIFLISFNGTSKRGVMHYKWKKKKKNNDFFFCQTLPICMRNSGISIIKSIANLKISWSFFIRKILRSTRTLDCDKYRLKSKGKFFSFCWAIFLYFSTPISWVMNYDKKCPRFVDPVRGWSCVHNVATHPQNMFLTFLRSKFSVDGHS